MGPLKKALMRVAFGQCGLDSASCSASTVEAVAGLDGPWAKGEASEDFILFAATIHRHGLPFQYARLEKSLVPDMCVCCNAPLWDPFVKFSRADIIFAWPCHIERCGGN